ncbi:hypothetical protein ERJ75_000978900 [Trypanosoma vivax]|nr:hypothetical protein ERJ75_000978900 [Trypanosoma vivax]
MRALPNCPGGPQKAVGKDKAPRPLFTGCSILGRTQITGAGAEEGQRRLPLQKVGVWTPSLPRFGAVWRNALQSPEPHSSKRGPKLRIGEADAGVMGRVGVIFEASQEGEGRWAVPPAIFEGKPAGPGGASLHSRRVRVITAIAKLRCRRSGV